MDSPLPQNVTLDQSSNTLLIVWSDGVSCRYPLTPLRLACPCAECRGGHENMGRRGDPDDLLALKSERVFRVTHIEVIGNYALQLVWDDGHSAGIYTWEYLRRLCPKRAT